jgi:hypothetical protein
MKRVLFILFGISAALTLFGLLFTLSRPIKWPAGIRSLEWRRTVDGPVGEVEVEEVAA